MTYPRFTMLPAALLILVCLFSLSQPSRAAVDIPGAEDLADFPRYPLSIIVSSENTVVRQYALAVGKFKKANGVAFLEEQKTLSGVVTKLTYEIPSGHRTDQVATFVEQQLSELQAKVLFQCHARGCGSSNDWANRQFQQATLYGLAGEQYYWAVQVNEAEHLAIYLTQRGNRKVFLHIESIRDPSAQSELSKEQMIANWEQGQRVSVIDISTNTEQLNALVAAARQTLAEQPYSKLWLVAHITGEKPFLILIEESQQQANQLRRQLIARGIAENRVEARGLGPLAPAYGDAPEQRIDILVE